MLDAVEISCEVLERNGDSLHGDSLHHISSYFSFSSSVFCFIRYQNCLDENPTLGNKFFSSYVDAEYLQ